MNAYNTRSLNILADRHGVDIAHVRTAARTFDIKIRNNGPRWFVADSHDRVVALNDYVARHAEEMRNRR